MILLLNNMKMKELIWLNNAHICSPRIKNRSSELLMKYATKNAGPKIETDNEVSIIPTGSNKL